MSESAQEAADYILPLNMNGLSGRMLKMPSKNNDRKREILFISGQHTSIERVYGLCEYLGNFGNVTSPDLPGFGGMEPFYKIKQPPTLDNMANYLASFIKLRYKNRRLTIIAVSYGFAVVTRMLQRYPDIAKKVDLLISVSGIVDKSNFRWKKRNIFFSHWGSRLLSRRLPAFIAKVFFIRGPFIRLIYKLAESKHPKLKDVDSRERKARIDFEIILWKVNDFRTWMATCVTMFTLKLTKVPVGLPVYHVAVDNDHYFDSSLVEEHMRSIYTDFKLVKGRGKGHAPTVISTPKDAAFFIPRKLARLLSQPT